jgi:hypothetical protein
MYSGATVYPITNPSQDPTNVDVDTAMKLSDSVCFDVRAGLYNRECQVHQVRALQQVLNEICRTKLMNNFKSKGIDSLDMTEFAMPACCSCRGCYLALRAMPKELNYAALAVGYCLYWSVGCHVPHEIAELAGLTPAVEFALKRAFTLVCVFATRSGFDWCYRKCQGEVARDTIAQYLPDELAESLMPPTRIVRLQMSSDIAAHFAGQCRLVRSNNKLELLRRLASCLTGSVVRGVHSPAAAAIISSMSEDMVKSLMAETLRTTRFTLRLDDDTLAVLKAEAEEKAPKEGGSESAAPSLDGASSKGHSAASSADGSSSKGSSKGGRTRRGKGGKGGKGGSGLAWEKGGSGLTWEMLPPPPPAHHIRQYVGAGEDAPAPKLTAEVLHERAAAAKAPEDDTASVGSWRPTRSNTAAAAAPRNGAGEGKLPRTDQAFMAQCCRTELRFWLLNELRESVASRTEEGHECQRQLYELPEMNYTDAYNCVTYALLTVPGVSKDMTDKWGADWGRKLFSAKNEATGKDVDVSLMEEACLNMLRSDMIGLAQQQLEQPEARKAAEATAQDSFMFVDAIAKATEAGDRQEAEALAENYAAEMAKNLEAQMEAIGYAAPEGEEGIISRRAIAGMAQGFVNIFVDTRLPPVVPLEPGFEPKFVEIEEASDDDYHAEPGDVDDAVAEGQADD